MKSTFFVFIYCGDVLTLAQASLHFILNKEYIKSLPSQVSLVDCRPSLRRDLLFNKPSFNKWIPSFVTLLCPRFNVSRHFAEACKQQVKDKRLLAYAVCICLYNSVTHVFCK
jgi:hypothetical protein